MFVVAYQKILQLSYVDKFLNDIHLQFRDKYKNELVSLNYFANYDFKSSFDSVVVRAEEWSKAKAKVPKQMKSFVESSKSKKTVASMIERKGDKDDKNKEKKKSVNFVAEGRLSFFLSRFVFHGRFFRIVCTG